MIGATRVFCAFGQLNASKHIAQLQFEDGLAKEYRELASQIPTQALLGQALNDAEYTPNAVTNGTSQNLSCNLGTLNSGAQATVTVLVRPSIAVSGPRTNTATVRSTDVGDPNQANNSGSVTSQVTAIVDVTAAKTATPSTVAAGARITFVATIGNTGPSTAQTVQMGTPCRPMPPLSTW